MQLHRKHKTLQNTAKKHNITENIITQKHNFGNISNLKFNCTESVTALKMHLKKKKLGRK